MCLLQRENKPTKNTQEDVGFLEFNRPGQVPPKDLLEFQILRIREEVLENPSVGVNDNFFELGGNSWLAVKMFVEFEKKTNQYLPLTTLLKAGTIAEFAKIIRKESDSEMWSTVVTIQPGNSNKPIFFAPGAAENGLVVARIAQLRGGL